jgi:decaprenyl-diphosphate synthase subunit 2
LIELISSAVRDLCESNFIGERDEQNNPIPSKPSNRNKKLDNATIETDAEHVEDNIKSLKVAHLMGIPEKEWEARHILSAGSLLGKSCQGALKLAGHPESLQKQGYLFGKHLALAWQACIDLDPFRMNTLPLGAAYNLVCAPVLFHLEHDPSLYSEIEKGRISVDNIDYAQIHSEVIKGPGLEKTRNLQRKHSLAAMKVLNELPPTDARTALQNIILAMQDL